ncbi:MAG: methylated-DNA--[protein]-cysteine S-methyltransferase [Candidatus Methanomethylophilaceae archaeon]|jgi:methylated-DNA-[protein]-cysteine S-methyltransferase
MAETEYIFTYVTLIGKISITEDGEGNITGLYLPSCNLPVACVKETEIIAEAGGQLEEYVSGRRKKFCLPLRAEGTEFASSVWKEISKIPYGETITYSELAKRSGNLKAYRAAGTACGKNPIPIFIPCHRVVPSSGGVGFYGGGSQMKYRLLALEEKFA